MNLQEATKAEQVFKNYGKEREKRVRDALRLARQTRDRIVSEIAVATSFHKYFLTQVIESINIAIAGYERDLIQLSNQGIEDMAKLGEQDIMKIIPEELSVQQSIIGIQPAVIDASQSFSAELIKNIGSEAKGKINNALQLGALGDKSPFQVAKDISTTLLRIEKYKGKMVARGILARGETIMRTELGRIYSKAQSEITNELGKKGVKMKKKWIATIDNRTRKEHQDAHNQEVDFDKPFNVGGENLDYPLDPKGSAWNTVNCRCTSINTFS